MKLRGNPIPTTIPTLSAQSRFSTQGQDAVRHAPSMGLPTLPAGGVQ